MQLFYLVWSYVTVYTDPQPQTAKTTFHIQGGFGGGNLGSFC